MKLLKNIALSSVLTLSLVTLYASENDDLAKLSTKIQDPLAKIISVPVFFNTYTDIGGSGKDNYASLIQPVVPFDIGLENTYVVARAIIPVEHFNVPDANGVGDTTLDIVFAHNLSKGLRIGAGPIFQIPTHTNELLGTDKWGAGLSAGAVLTEGRWVIGGLATQIWDVDGSDSGSDINQFTFQPIINYDFGDKGGWIFTSTSLIVANWDRPKNVWDIPVGGGVSKIFKFGKLPIAISPQVYYHTQDGYAKWEGRLMFRFLLPK